MLDQVANEGWDGPMGRRLLTFVRERLARPLVIGAGLAASRAEASASQAAWEVLAFQNLGDAAKPWRVVGRAAQRAVTGEVISARYGVGPWQSWLLARNGVPQLVGFDALIELGLDAGHDEHSAVELTLTDAYETAITALREVGWTGDHADLGRRPSWTPRSAPDAAEPAEQHLKILRKADRITATELTSAEKQIVVTQCLSLASRAGLDGEGRCNGSTPIFLSGRSDVAERTQHDLDVILTRPAAWVQLNRQSPPNDRRWLRDNPACDGRVENVLDCDEFPYASTQQGGQFANPPVSLRVLDAGQNSFRAPSSTSSTGPPIARSTTATSSGRSHCPTSPARRKTGSFRRSPGATTRCSPCPGDELLRMSAAEIVDALDGWVERIGRLGAAVVPRLRPGLLPDQIVETAARHGFVLSKEIAAIWAWHDGERTDADRGTPKQFPGLTPGDAFYDLDSTLGNGLSRWYATCGDDEELADPHSKLTEEFRSAIWRREWVIFGWWLLPLVLASAADGSTDTFRFDPQSGTAWVAHSTLPERIAQWHRHLDLGAWQVLPDGTWGGDNGKLPRIDRTASQAEQIRLTEVT